MLLNTVSAEAEKDLSIYLKPKEIKSLMKKVADWQIFHFQDRFSFNRIHDPLHWTNGALYSGMTRWAKMAEDDRYYVWLKGIGEKHKWKLGKRIYHADDHVVGQMYMELYRKYKNDGKPNIARIINPLKDRFNYILTHPSNSKLNWKTPYHQDRWNWCDALFMSPPLWAMLYKETGQDKYLDFMVSEFKETTDFLFDPQEHLYFRDENFFDKIENGSKVFWARGNGWVFAGLVNILRELGLQSDDSNYFIDIYKKMAEKLISIQTKEGHWAMSLLGADFYPTPETSGSSFFTYGLAWGVNQGILDRIKYLKPVTNAWKAIAGHVSKEGYIGYVQPIGAAPGKAWKDKTEVYGTGAFLSAGSEVYELFSQLNDTKN